MNFTQDSADWAYRDAIQAEEVELLAVQDIIESKEEIVNNNEMT